MVWPIPEPTVTVWWDLQGRGGEYFTWGDPLRGWGSGYVWAGDIATDLTAPVHTIAITRGRATDTDTIDVGTCQIELVNPTRDLDPNHIPSPYFGNIRPNKRVKVTVAGVTTFDGRIDDFNFTYGADQTSMVTITASDALAQLAATDLGAFTATAGQLPGARIDAILSRDEVNFGVARAIDAGVSPLQGDLVAAGTNTLGYVQEIARTDLGRFFASRDNVLTYRDRRSTHNNIADPMLFSDGPSSIPAGDLFIIDAGLPATVTPDVYVAGDPDTVPTVVYTAGTPADPPAAVDYPTEWAGFLSVSLEYGTEQLYTRTVVSRLGGSVETFTDEEHATVDEYDIRSTRELYTDLLLETDAQSYALGLYLLGRHSTPRQRFTSLVVDLATLTDSQVGMVLAAEIGGLVRVLFTPDRVGSPIDQYCVIEGRQDDYGVDRGVLVFDLSEADQRAVWVWGDPVYGVWGGPGVFVF